MLDGSGRVRVMDFGLAAVGRVEDVSVGTPAYTAPEQLMGREVTARSDIFALGLVMYELFTGRRAFMARTVGELVNEHESRLMTPPSAIVSSLDAAIERAILRCLEPDPERRPASAVTVSVSLPGGDPLAAALAAGETPSPEMVAAAGEGAGNSSIRGPAPSLRPEQLHGRDAASAAVAGPRRQIYDAVADRSHRCSRHGDRVKTDRRDAEKPARGYRLAI